MDYDDERPLERIVRPSRAAEDGRIPELLTEKSAQQEHEPGSAIAPRSGSGNKEPQHAPTA
jgi:hypothetical protein